MTRKGCIGVLLLLGAIGCGGGGGGHHLTTYALVPTTAESVPAQACVGIEGPFTVPVASTMAFSVEDTPVGFGNDSMEVGIMFDSDFVNAGGCDFNKAVVDDQIVGSYADSGPVPAGTYTFVVGCGNAIDTCFFNLDWTATY